MERNPLNIVTEKDAIAMGLEVVTEEEAITMGLEVVEIEEEDE